MNTLPNNAILNSQNSNQFPPFHVPSLFPHYCTHKLHKAKLSHKILFEDK